MFMGLQRPRRRLIFILLLLPTMALAGRAATFADTAENEAPMEVHKSDAQAGVAPVDYVYGGNDHLVDLYTANYGQQAHNMLFRDMELMGGGAAARKNMVLRAAATRSMNEEEEEKSQKENKQNKKKEMEKEENEPR